MRCEGERGERSRDEMQGDKVQGGQGVGETWCEGDEGKGRQEVRERGEGQIRQGWDNSVLYTPPPTPCGVLVKSK
jgi:hypothetical protein